MNFVKRKSNRFFYKTQWIGSISAIAFFFGMIGCNPNEDAQRLQKKNEQPSEFDARLDLISPKNCTLRNGRLVQCVIPEQRAQVEITETAVPLKTIVRRQIEGKCSITYPLEVTLSASTESWNFRYAQDTEIVIRSSTNEPINELIVTDSSPWTSVGAFDDSCRIDIIIAFNEPDVSSSAEAQAFIRTIENDLIEKRAETERYRALLHYSEAYSFMQTIAETFHLQLTNDMMQELRHSALDAAPAFEEMIISCEGNMSPEQRQNLLRLYFALGTLGSPDDWTHPDGTIKSLNEFLGDAASEVLTVVEQIRNESEAGNQQEYEKAYKEASLEVAQLEAKLELARTQLADYLKE